MELHRIVQISVWEKIGSSPAVEREFDLDPEITGDIETAREYCRWANDNVGEQVFFTSNPDEDK